MRTPSSPQADLAAEVEQRDSPAGVAEAGSNPFVVEVVRTVVVRTVVVAEAGSNSFVVEVGRTVVVRTVVVA